MVTEGPSDMQDGAMRRRLLIPASSEAQRQNNFDAIRLAMALLVVWSHSFALHQGTEDREFLSLLFNGTYNSGNVGVMVFFIISGFLITHSFVRSSSWKSFMGRRIRRIYPGYLVATTLCAFVVVPLYSNMMDSSLAEVGKTLGLNLLLQNHFPPSTAFAVNPVPNAVNGSLWSISFEFWCYIGVAALGVLGLLRRKWLLLAALIAVLLARVVLDLLGRKPGLGIIGDIIGWPYLWTKILPSFLLGMVIYWFKDRLPRHPLILFGSLGLAIGAAHFSHHVAHLVFAPALAYATFYLAFSPKVRLTGASRWGDFSYGTYLYAFPVQQMLYASYGLELSLTEYIGLSMIFSLAAGIASWHFVERWFLPSRRAGAESLDREARLVAP